VKTVYTETTVTIPESVLWDLVDKWQKYADQKITGPFLSERPVTAWAQGLNEAAEDLSDLILEYEEGN
jgi:hypothetical protein